MKTLTEPIIKAWENKKGPIVLTTVNKDKVPNSIYASCVSLYDSHTILVADNYFSKTMENILDGSSGAVLFITEDDKSFQIKGSVKYEKKGKLFDDMKKWNPEKHPGHAVAVIEVEEVYSGSEKLI